MADINYPTTNDFDPQHAAAIDDLIFAYVGYHNDVDTGNDAGPVGALVAACRAVVEAFDGAPGDEVTS